MVCTKTKKKLKILELVTEIRRFEISLFWSRSLFFWGFTAIAITAYGAAWEFAPIRNEIQFAVACAGFICSFVWTLVNRSSKYWQGTWEKKAERPSREAVGHNLFAEYPRPRFAERIKKFPWWAAHFSVSKLATAFSDFTGLVWVGLGLKAAGVLYVGSNTILWLAVATSVYVICIFAACGPDRHGKTN